MIQMQSCTEHHDMYSAPGQRVNPRRNMSYWALVLYEPNDRIRSECDVVGLHARTPDEVHIGARALDGSICIRIPVTVCVVNCSLLLVVHE